MHFLEKMDDFFKSLIVYSTQDIAISYIKYSANKNFLPWKLFYSAQVHTTVFYHFTVDEFHSLHTRTRYNTIQPYQCTAFSFNFNFQFIGKCTIFVQTHWNFHSLKLFQLVLLTMCFRIFSLFVWQNNLREENCIC